MKEYYYPISSACLASIFSQACILPACLYNNRLPDVQNKYDQFVLLTDKLGCAESDCCLQIVLTPDEVQSLIDVNGGFFFFNEALPISRIKKIYFAKATQAARTVSSINLSTAFIPENIVDRHDTCFENISTNSIKVPVGTTPSIEIVKTSYEKYNRILGAMALMKVSHTEGCNYSTHYIDTLSKFNEFIKEQKGRVSAVNDKFHKIIDNSDTPLCQNIDMELLNGIANRYNQTLEKNKTTRKIDPSNLEGIVYICYVLYDYGVGEESHTHKIDDLILNNFNGVKEGYGEACALYYGFNRGYSVFNNEYRKEGKTEVVKFQLNSRFDYYTIESIFEYTFHNRVSSTFGYLDTWVKAQTPGRPRKGEYLILDKIVRDKKKVLLFSEEWWKICLASLAAKDDFKILGTDFSKQIIDKFLKPFAKLIKDELTYDYEENLQKHTDEQKERIVRLENEVDDYKKQIECLKSELDKKQDVAIISETAPAYNAEIAGKTSDEEQSDSIDENKMSKPFNLEVYDKKVVKLFEKSKDELTKMAKEKGCQVKKADKNGEIVLKILAAERNTDNHLLL